MTTRLIRGVAAVVAVLAAGAAVALATTPLERQATRSIRACVDGKGRVRLPAAGAACTRRERAVTWNVQGPKGEAGAKSSAMNHTTEAIPTIDPAATSSRSARVRWP